MILEINPEHPQPRLISRVVESLKDGRVIAYPTDTTYGIGCSIFCKKSIERIYQMKQRDRRKPFSVICSSLSEISQYARVSNSAFKIIKRLLPGIIESSIGIIQTGLDKQPARTVPFK